MKVFDVFRSDNVRTSNIKKNILGSILIKGISIIIQLLLVPMTLGYVNSELYGIWLTLSSIVLWLNFFDVGFTLGLKNKLAEAIAQNDYDKGKSLVSTTYFMMILIFVPLCIILVSVIPLVNWTSLLNVNDVYSEEIEHTLYILSICLCLQMIVNVLVAIVAAFQKVALSSSFPVIGNALSLVAIFILTKTCSPSLTYLAIAISVMPIIVVALLTIYLFNNRFKEVSPSFSSVNKRYIKDILSLGLKFFVIQIQQIVLFQSTNILITNVSGPYDVTTYNIAYKYLGIAMMIYSIILNPLWPAFTDAYTKGEYKWMKGVYKKMIHVYGLSVIFMFLMIIASPYVYQLWIGNKTNIPFVMTVVVGLCMMISTWDALQVQLINGIGCVKLQSYVTLLGLIFHIPLSLFLGQYWGAIGVVVSKSIIIIIYSLCFTIQLNKILNQKAVGIWAA